MDSWLVFILSLSLLLLFLIHQCDLAFKIFFFLSSLRMKRCKKKKKFQLNYSTISEEMVSKGDYEI